MKTVSCGSLLDAFVTQLPAAPRRALLVDYDGTLAPFRVERKCAVPYPGVIAVLERLLAAGHTRVVIISGRAVADLERLLGPTLMPELWGSHGWERRLPDGTHQAPRLPQAAHVGLAAAAEVAELQGLSNVLEHKPAGLAVHWRGLSPPVAGALHTQVTRAWQPLVEEYGLVLHPFDGGVELRVPGRDKGTAVRTILDELGPGAAVAYLGDDLTDEDAFSALGERGLRVLVRDEPRPSAADLWLRPPGELLAFLNRWAEITV